MQIKWKKITEMNMHYVVQVHGFKGVRVMYM